MSATRPLPTPGSTHDGPGPRRGQVPGPPARWRAGRVPLGLLTCFLLLPLPGCGGEAPAGRGADPPDVSRPAGADSERQPRAGAAGPPGGAAGPAWTRAPLEGAGTSDSVAVLRAVRVARHEGFDRVVLEFAAALPAWRVAPLGGEPVACGSGRTVELRGEATLRIELEPARAHTEAGESTLGRRAWDAGFPALRELRLTCDFEAHVALAAGVAEAAAFRAFALAGPPRLVVDVAHPQQNP